MSYATQLAAIYGRFQGEFTGVPVRYANYETVNAAGRALKDPGTLPEWVHLTVEPTATTQRDINAAYLSETVGVINATVWVRADTGMIRAYQIADQISEVFGRRSFDGIKVNLPALVDLGEVDGFHGVAVTFEYSTFQFGS